jgi:CheY-like chemotaxis protein
MVEENRPRAPALSSLTVKPVAYTYHPRKVLVVEDNFDSVRALAALIEDMGHEVKYAINGYAALEIVKAWLPDFILLDIGLPSMDGFDLCRRLRANRALDECRLIALTAYGKDEDRVKSRDAGCELHLIKPVPAQQIFDLLETERSPAP